MFPHNNALFFSLAYAPVYGSNYKCNQKVVYQSNNSNIEYCYISDTSDGSLTWSHAQGACLSLNYTSLAAIDTLNKQIFIYYSYPLNM